VIKQKVYLAGGFKSNWQSIVINKLSGQFVFFNPRGHELKDTTLYSAWDIHFVKECDILFGYMESTNPSGYGLAFEIGLSFGLNKTIILVDERSAVDPDFGKYYSLIRFPCASVFSTLDEGIHFLEKFAIH